MAQDAISLTLESRDVTGKAVKHLRKAGIIPAVIHDHGKNSVIVQGDSVELGKVFKKAGKHHPIILKTGTQTYTALIKAAAFDPKKHLLTHVVFNAVDANEKVEAEIPIQARFDEGNEASPAERSGLLVLSQLETINVAAVPSMLPEVLYYDAEKLIEVGDHISVSDVSIPEGVEVKTDLKHSVATVYEPSALQAANEAAGGDAEEVSEELPPEGETGEAEETTEDSAESEAEASADET